MDASHLMNNYSHYAYTRMNKKLLLIALAMFSAGSVMIVGGIGGIAYTYNAISNENIVTPDDASIPKTQVRGPLTIKAQADAIRMHTMKRTDGLTFASMPRTIPKLDENKNPVLDAEGKPVMVPNELRSGAWMPALTLTTALQLSIISYAFSLLSLVLGVLFAMNGYVVLTLRKN